MNSQPTFTLFENCRVYGNKGIEQKHFLVFEGRIVSVLESAKVEALRLLAPVMQIDLDSQLVLPGLIDGHVHILGAAGEAGPQTRAPEIPASAFARSGTTTVVGMLGTDRWSRSIESLIAKTRALNREGLTAYCLTGSYQFPPVTLTGDVCRDIYFFEEVLGVGEIACSDHRSSAPTTIELRRLIQDSFTAARAKGRKGNIVLHFGDEKDGLTSLSKIIADSDFDSSGIIATHINRNQNLMSQACNLDLGSAWVDLTAIYFNSQPPGTFHHVEDALPRLLDQKPDLLNHLTVTSDAGTAVQGRATSPQGLFRAFRQSAERIGIESCIKIFAENPAAAFGFQAKGKLEIGYDADFMVLSDDHTLRATYAKGRCIFDHRKPTDIDTYASYLEI